MKKHHNPLLEEIWEIKARLVAESGNDLHVFCEQLRAWTAAHPHPGLVVRSLEELQAWREEKEREETLVLREEPPAYGAKKE